MPSLSSPDEKIKNIKAINDFISQNSRFSWLSAAFDASNIRSVADGKIPKQIEFYIETVPKSVYSLTEIYEELYTILKSFYRNEYVIRNEIINELYTERHDIAISNTLSEFRVGSSRVDLAVFNGTSTCYEIKTEIDNLRRLSNQIIDYCQLFDKVYIVTTEKKLDEVVKTLPEYVGIITFSEDCYTTEYRHATSNKSRMRQEILFQALRKEEHFAISAQRDAEILQFDPVTGYFRSKEIFCALTIDEAHTSFMEALASRKVDKSIQVLRKLPHSLASAYFSTKMTSRLWRKFVEQIAVSRETS